MRGAQIELGSWRWEQTDREKVKRLKTFYVKGVIMAERPGMGEVCGHQWDVSMQDFDNVQHVSLGVSG